MKRILFFLILLGGVIHVLASSPELGTVKWGRDLDAALVTSKETGKPVFLLFQEVPG